MLGDCSLLAATFTTLLRESCIICLKLHFNISVNSLALSLLSICRRASHARARQLQHLCQRSSCAIKLQPVGCVGKPIGDAPTLCEGCLLQTSARQDSASLADGRQLDAAETQLDPPAETQAVQTRPLFVKSCHCLVCVWKRVFR